jgi:hypothetical protein
MDRDMRRFLPVLALTFALLAACTREEEPVANKFERQAAEIENKARALETQVENDVSAVEARLQNEVDALARNDAAAPAEANGSADGNRTR